MYVIKLDKGIFKLYVGRALGFWKRKKRWRSLTDNNISIRKCTFYKSQLPKVYEKKPSLKPPLPERCDQPDYHKVETGPVAPPPKDRSMFALDWNRTFFSKVLILLQSRCVFKLEHIFHVSLPFLLYLFSPWRYY